MKGPTPNDIARDVRFTLRSLRRNPGFAAATILVLGIGVGAISLMFSTYNTVVLRPLPLPEPERLTWVWATTPNGSRNSISYDDYVDYRDETDAFLSLAALGVFSQRWLLTGGDDARQVRGYNVSANFFATLGVAPALGRAFIAADERRGQDDVVILSHNLWKTRYGADPAVIGRTIGVDGRPVEVAGIMPAGFDFPAGSDVWFPLQQSAGYAAGRWNSNFFAIGRLREEATLEQAQAQLTVVAADIAEAHPDARAEWSVELQTLHERYFGPAGASILILMGIIALVPLVACANVASLFMAQAVTRKTEIASRMALGAPRSRLIRQLLTEGLVVALGGGAVGLGLAYGGGEALRRFAPAALPRLDAIAVDSRVMTFTLLAALVTVPLFAIVPALRGTDIDIAETLKGGAGRGGSGLRLKGRNGLVIAQVAFSLMLMLASGLLLRGYQNLQTVDLGFQTRNIVYSQVALPSFKYGDDAQVRLVWDELLSQLRATPGVLAVGAADRPPISGRGPTNEVWASQRPPTSAADERDATRRFVSDQFFEVMGIPLRAGRTFGRHDERAGQPVTVINETLAHEFFPGEDAVRQTLVLKWDPLVSLTVIGVVADVREQGPGLDSRATFYLPAWWAPRLNMHVLARTRGAPLDIANLWRETIRVVEPDIPDSPMQTMEERLSTSLFEPRFRSTLVTLFALVSLVLSAIGLYGVLAYFVRAQVHQLGIRLALGASATDVARSVVLKGMSLVAWGTLIGMVAGLLGAQVISNRGLPGFVPYDAMTYVAVIASLTLTALAACAVPAIRALHIDPLKVMRVE